MSAILDALPAIATATGGMGLIGGFFAAVAAIQMPEFFGRPARPRPRRSVFVGAPRPAGGGWR